MRKRKPLNPIVVTSVLVVVVLLVVFMFWKKTTPRRVKPIPPEKLTEMISEAAKSGKTVVPRDKPPEGVDLEAFKAQQPFLRGSGAVPGGQR